MITNQIIKPTEKRNWSFEGKVALVTGSGRGIGKTIATAFGTAGAAVAICDVDRKTSRETVRSLRKAGVNARYFAVDLSQRGGPSRMIVRVAEEFGRLDVLINNARAGKRIDIHEDTEDNWDMTISVGLKAAYFASRQAIPIMGSRGGGCIVNIGSVSAFLVSHESAGYHAAKGGLLQLTRYLAARAGKQGVRVNAVLPGFIVQDEHRKRYSRHNNSQYRARAERCHPVGRVGYASDIANATLFLCSELAGFITGQAVVVDGGLTIQDPWAVMSSASDSPKDQ